MEGLKKNKTKSSKRKLVIYREVPIRLSADFLREILQAEGLGKKYSKSSYTETYSQDCSTWQSYHLELKGR